MTQCHDCRVAVGELHIPGCDVERCPKCGGQRISCGCRSRAKGQPWTGKWPGEEECRAFGWYSKWVEGKGWFRCGADDPDATLDLNRLAAEGKWNAVTQRYERRT